MIQYIAINLISFIQDANLHTTRSYSGRFIALKLNWKTPKHFRHFTNNLDTIH